ncbi:CNNM domain-containing protein [Ectobacillus panaciterrae]|uniref:hemolysin family protein n=1 Tax=Ectobacillus panaciterrae TaxID=363872 RepID=UPI00048AEB16
MDIFNLSMVTLLIALTAFFVAAEFAILKIRSSRVDYLIAEGSKRAIAVKTVISNLDGYLSACQLGITVTALGLGWLGEPAIKRMLYPVFIRLEVPPSFSTLLSVFLSFTLITFLHVVIGELAPKTFAIQKAEGINLAIAKPLIFFYHLAYPFIWLLNGSARLIVGLFGLQLTKEHEAAHSEEELRMLVSESYRNGEINQSEYKYVNKIFEFDDRIAKEIMVPRTEMVTIEKGESLAQVMQMMSNEKYTRYPVIDKDKDHIVGMVNFKDVFTDFAQEPKVQVCTVEHYARPIIQVIESIPIHDLFLKMQRDRTHMAILVDEYGGTSGLVTVEDILEEIVGEIQDEFDTDEQPEIQHISETKTILEGKVLVSEVNHLFGLAIDDSDVDTISGWILTEHFEIQQGDSIQIENYKFRILELDGHYIKHVEVIKQQTAHLSPHIATLTEQVSS